jgi:hypothetical protein
MIFELSFWTRRADDDQPGDEDPVPFELTETSQTRSADGDPENRDAPWWDVRATAKVEAEDLERAWAAVERHVCVVERLSAVSRTA